MPQLDVAQYSPHTATVSNW